MNLIVTDLDRTLLNNNGSISDQNLNALNKLRSNRFVTAIATGRNLYSAYKVLPPDLPLDYLIFSSGCGIMQWRDNKIILKQSLDKASIEKAVEVLIKHQADFMIHEQIPANHKFVFYQNGFYNSDFHNRIKLYSDFAQPWDGKYDHKAASQILAVIPVEEMKKFNIIKKELDFVKVIRATSPLDHETLWLEIFPENVSKGHAVQWLCEKLKIQRRNTFSLGNDYNDIDMLNWTSSSYVVSNAPDDLKKIYPVTASNEENGFTDWVENKILIGN